MRRTELPSTKQALRASWSESPWWAAAALIALAAAVYHPVFHFGFVNWDDYGDVVNNGYVRQGLSWGSTVWAFTTTYNANYIPLTRLSHMLDCGLFGLWAGGHHAVSLLWHVLNTLLLFAFLREATGSGARSFWVAALFAVHPLHVESVAWISERKDVLSTFFWFAGLWTYVRYVRQPSWARYAAVAGAFVLGLLAKPMLVTFPFTLLLLDYWPLKRWAAAGETATGSLSKRAPAAPAGETRIGRFESQRLWMLLKEKIPLFLLVPIFSVTAVIAQRTTGAISSTDLVRPIPRLCNAVVSLGQYLWHLPLPVNLAAIYPHPGNTIAWSSVLASAAAVAVLTAAALRWGRRFPYLVVGWLWFLGTLIPVLGLVQVGFQAWADRYSYVPYVGLFVAIVWLVGDLVSSAPVIRRAAAVAGAAMLLTFAWLAHAQTLTWKDDPSLFGRIVERFPNAFQGHYHMADFYRTHGRWEEAVSSYRRAIAASPDRFDAWTNLGLALQGLGRNDEAASALRKACAMNPGSSAAAFNLAQMDETLGRAQEAEKGYRRALEINPLEERSLMRLGTMLVARGDFAEARPLLQKLAWLCVNGWTAGTTAAEIAPLCVRTELWAEAESLLAEAVRENPGDAGSWSYLGLARQRLHLYGPAIEAYGRAVRIEPRMAGAWFNLGAAYIQVGDFAGATRTFETLQTVDPPTAARLMDLIRQEQARRGSGGPPTAR